MKLSKYHYTYITRARDKRYYIGVRTCECDPADDSYMGSHKDATYIPTQKRILSTFETREAALAHEIFLHNWKDVAVNPKYANRAKQTSTGFNSFGVEHREETRRKISKAGKGKKRSEDTRRKISEARKGERWFHDPVSGTATHCLLVSCPDGYLPGSGKSNAPVSEETRRKISEAHKGKNWFHDPISGAKTCCLPEDCPDGYLPGRGGSSSVSDETRRKQSKAKKGKKRRPQSEETRRKISEVQKRKKWFHDPASGAATFCLAESCPDGWEPGMKPRKSNND